MSDGWLAWSEATRLLESAGVPRPPGVLVTSGAQLRGDDLPWPPPVVVKVVGPDPVHKAAAGLLRLGLCGLEETVTAVDDLLARAASTSPGTTCAALVQPMVLGGVEIFVGGVRDDEFGPVIGVGFGGGMVEELGRVAFRSCAALSTTDVDEMLAEANLAPLLDRRCDPTAGPALARLVRDVAALMTGSAGVIELDLNPVMLRAADLIVVDARINIAADGAVHEPEEV